jgi:hypothetical protein
LRRGEGWTDPTCTGMYVKKTVQHEELVVTKD